MRKFSLTRRFGEGCDMLAPFILGLLSKRLWGSFVAQTLSKLMNIIILEVLGVCNCGKATIKKYSMLLP